MQEQCKTEPLIRVFAVLFDDRSRKRGHILPRLGERDPGLQTGENFVPVIAAIIRRKIGRDKNLRHPEFGRRRIVEALRHNPDNLAASAIDDDFLAHNLWVGAEGALPEPIAENNNAIASLLGLFGQECPADGRIDPENRKQSWRNCSTGDALRIAAAETQVERAGA